jgi:hypothetical protein
MFAMRLTCLLAFLSCSWACAATTYSPSVVETTLDDALVSAQAHHEAGRPVEAAQLLEPLLEIDPGHPGARELRDALGPDVEHLFDHPYLGSNFAKRPKTDRPIAARLLLYLPDRLLDLTDILSLDVHLGLGAFANLHFTRAGQLGVGVRGVGGVGWHDHRSLGFQGQAESGIALPGIGAQAFSGGVAGTSGAFAAADASAGVHRPSGRLYQQLRDYWAVGAGFTAGPAGVDFDLHPIELADFLVGIAGVDLLHDDFAQTRGLALTRRERTLLGSLAEIQRSPESIEVYRAASREAPAAPAKRVGAR